MEVEPLTAVTDYGDDAKAPMGLLLLCSRWRLVAVLISVAASWLGGAALCAAEIDPVALLWNAPAECPSADAVHDQVEKSLGTSVKDLAPVAAVVNVATSSPKRWRAQLTVHARGERAERQFEAESCDALSAAAALIIALAAEGPTPAGVAPFASGPAPSQRPGNGAQAATVSSSVAPPPAGEWKPFGLVLQVDLSLDNGSMPGNPEPGIEAAFGAVWNSSLWRLRLLGGLSYFLPQDNKGDESMGVPAFGRYSLLALSARGCLTAALDRFEPGLCLGGELVAMHGSSIGGGDASDTQYWLSPLGGVVAAFTVAPGIAMFAQVEIAVPSTRRTYMGVPNGPSVNVVYTVPSYTVRGAVGIEVRFF